MTGVVVTGKLLGVRLVIDVDLDLLPNDSARETGRILRFWAGALPQMHLTEAAEHALLDSNYQPVGSLRLTATPPS